MAYPTFDNGAFEITALSFSPSVIAPGETTQFSVTLKNVSGVAISKCRVELEATYKSSRSDGRKGSTATVFLYGSDDYYGESGGFDSISWGKNVSKTFSGTVTFNLNGQFPIDTTEYVMNTTDSYFWIGVTAKEFITGDGNYDNCYTLRGTNSEYLTMLSYKDNPQLKFAVERTPDDESSSLATTLKLTGDTDSSLITAHGYSLKLYCVEGSSAATTSDSQVTLNCTISTACTGFTESTSLITQTFSNGNDYSFLLYLTNGYENAYAVGSIARAFANMHLSGCSTGGVAFGKFCKSTENNPMFECNYPAYFYKGVQGFAQGGVETAVTVSGNNYVDVAVTFAKAFDTDVVPMVLVGFGKDTATSDQYVGRISAYVVNDSVTNKGFTARICSQTSNSYAIRLRWLAIAI